MSTVVKKTQKKKLPQECDDVTAKVNPKASKAVNKKTKSNALQSLNRKDSKNIKKKVRYKSEQEGGVNEDDVEAYAEAIFAPEEGVAAPEDVEEEDDEEEPAEEEPAEEDDDEEEPDEQVADEQVADEQVADEQVAAEEEPDEEEDDEEEPDEQVADDAMADVDAVTDEESVENNELEVESDNKMGVKKIKKIVDDNAKVDKKKVISDKKKLKKEKGKDSNAMDSDESDESKSTEKSRGKGRGKVRGDEWKYWIDNMGGSEKKYKVINKSAFERQKLLEKIRKVMKGEPEEIENPENPEIKNKKTGAGKKRGDEWTYWLNNMGGTEEKYESLNENPVERQKQLINIRDAMILDTNCPQKAVRDFMPTKVYDNGGLYINNTNTVNERLLNIEEQLEKIILTQETIMKKFDSMNN